MIPNGMCLMDAELRVNKLASGSLLLPTSVDLAYGVNLIRHLAKVPTS